MRYSARVELEIHADNIKEAIDKLITRLIDSPSFRIVEVKEIEQ